MNPTPPPTPPRHATRPAPLRRGQARQIVVGALVGVVLTVIIGLVLFVLLVKEDLPPLTAERLEAAMARWREHGPSGYNLDLAVSGTQSGKVHLEVRDGEVTEMTYNGRALESPSARKAWTVEEMFEMMYRELDYARELGADGRVMLRAEFDSELGYPERYKRLMLGEQGPIEWVVTGFEETDGP